MRKDQISPLYHHPVSQTMRRGCGLIYVEVLNKGHLILQLIPKKQYMAIKLTAFFMLLAFLAPMKQYWFNWYRREVALFPGYYQPTTKISQLHIYNIFRKNIFVKNYKNIGYEYSVLPNSAGDYAFGGVPLGGH